jgi:hypothetical protein
MTQAKGPEETIGGVSIAFWVSANELARILGREEAERLARENPDAYARAKVAAIESNMLDAGIIPPWFTGRGICDKCGEVPLPRGALERPPSCPWCNAMDRPRMTHDNYLRRARLRHESYLRDVSAAGPPRLTRTPDGFFSMPKRGE